jgi:hypothetical protein
MSIIKLNHPYKCRHCGRPYVILQGYFRWSFLPVELITGEEINDAEFDSKKHRSHLLDCPQLQAQWESVKKMMNKQAILLNQKSII